jgi:hypothetical protein
MKENGNLFFVEAAEGVMQYLMLPLRGQRSTDLARLCELLVALCLQD